MIREITIHGTPVLLVGTSADAVQATAHHIRRNIASNPDRGVLFADSVIASMMLPSMCALRAEGYRVHVRGAVSESDSPLATHLQEQCGADASITVGPLSKACSALMKQGEFAPNEPGKSKLDALVVSAQPRGLFLAMQALGVTPDWFAADAPVFDGEPPFEVTLRPWLSGALEVVSHQPQVSLLPWLLVKQLALNENRDEGCQGRNKRAELYGLFVRAAMGSETARHLLHEGFPVEPAELMAAA